MQVLIVLLVVAAVADSIQANDEDVKRIADSLREDLAKLEQDDEKCMRDAFSRLGGAGRALLVGLGRKVVNDNPDLADKGPGWFKQWDIKLTVNKDPTKIAAKVDQFERDCANFMASFSDTYAKEVKCQAYFGKLYNSDRKSRVAHLIETLDLYFTSMPERIQDSLRACFIVGTQYNFVTDDWFSPVWRRKRI